MVQNRLPNTGEGVICDKVGQLKKYFSKDLPKSERPHDCTDQDEIPRIVTTEFYSLSVLYRYNQYCDFSIMTWLYKLSKTEVIDLVENVL